MDRNSSLNEIQTETTLFESVDKKLLIKYENVLFNVGWIFYNVTFVKQFSFNVENNFIHSSI